MRAGGCWRSTNISHTPDYSLFRVCVPWAAFSRDWTQGGFDADAKYIIILREVRFSREPIGGAWEPSSLRNYICISVINTISQFYFILVPQLSNRFSTKHTNFYNIENGAF